MNIPKISMMMLLLPAANVAGSSPLIAQVYRFIVQAPTFEEARFDVRLVGGSVRLELEVMRAVEADLTEKQDRAIRKFKNVHVYRSSWVDAD